MSNRPIHQFEPVERCMLCGTADRHPVRGVSFKGVAFSYSICGQCGLKFMDPAPTRESLDAFFREQYWQANLKAEGFPTGTGYDDKKIDQLALRQQKYQASFEIVRDHVKSVRPLGPSTRFLEVGCAFGYTLEYLHRDFGAQVFGIEPSSESVKRCESAGVKIVSPSAESYFVGAKNIKEADKYDVILFRHVLETLLDPRPVLRGLREYLKSDGLLLIHTPNVEYYDLMSPFTPFCYSPETIARLLKVTGFTVDKVLAPKSPVDRQAALRATPKYEMYIFGRPGAVTDVTHPRVDPLKVARTIQLGNTASQWHSLFAGDLFSLLREKVERRFKFKTNSR